MIHAANVYTDAYLKVVFCFLLKLCLVSEQFLNATFDIVFPFTY